MKQISLKSLYLQTEIKNVVENCITISNIKGDIVIENLKGHPVSALCIEKLSPHHEWSSYQFQNVNIIGSHHDKPIKGKL